MGRKHVEVSEEEKLVPYKVEPDSSGRVQVTIPNAENNTFSPPEISVMVLQKMQSVSNPLKKRKRTIKKIILGELLLLLSWAT